MHSTLLPVSDAHRRSMIDQLGSHSFPVAALFLWVANRECASTVQIVLFVMHDTAAASFCDARHSANGQSKLV